jgi:hypothetical protein
MAWPAGRKVISLLMIVSMASGCTHAVTVPVQKQAGKPSQYEGKHRIVMSAAQCLSASAEEFILR